MSEGDGIQVSISNSEDFRTGKRSILISGLTAEQADEYLQLLQQYGDREPSPEWDTQEMPVEEIWLQPEAEGIDACVIMKMAAGPKRYARYFPSASPGPHHETPRIEWGWIKGETAVQVWPEP